MITLRNKEDKYILSTVRIETDTGTGTGFITKFSDDIYGKLTDVYFLVTNKHVIKNGKKITIKMHKLESNFRQRGNELEIDLENHSEATIETNLNELFFFHPNENVDIALVNFNQTILKKFISLFIPIDIDNTIPVRNSNQINLYDDITFIGYPNGLYDEKHLLPIIRRGSFATSYQVDFNWNPIFLIDASVFPGSSGSPVFLFDRHDTEFDGKKMNLSTPRIYFLGIISAVYTRDELFNLIQVQNIKAHGKQMIDIGIVYKASEIRKLMKMYLIENIAKSKILDINDEESMDKILKLILEQQ